MGRTGNVFARSFAPVMFAGLIVATTGTGAESNDNCRRLEALARQYAGVQLTSDQKRLKRRLVAWYNGNCQRTRSAQARD